MSPTVSTKLSGLLFDHAIAIIAVAAAFGLTICLWDFIEPEAAPLFLAAVAIAAWRGGIYPSLVATALAALVLDYFFNPPLNAFEISLKNAVGTSVFLTVALLISYIDRARNLALAERERMLERERRALAEAEKSNRAKDVFLTMVTHELRSPLSAVLGWTHILRDRTPEPALTARALNAIERSTRTQVQLVEDLVDISRVRNGNFRINAVPLELCGVINSAVEAVVPALEAKRIRLDLDLDERIGLVNGDAERLRQVVWNLLSNAVKFARDEGQIEIRLTRAGNHARLRVYDDGAGIRRDFLPFVFDSFRQADESDHAKYKGLGLGLAIVRHLTEAHGGTVTAASAGENLGATFTVELPLRAEFLSGQELKVETEPKRDCC